MLGNPEKPHSCGAETKHDETCSRDSRTAVTTRIRRLAVSVSECLGELYIFETVSIVPAGQEGPCLCQLPQGLLSGEMKTARELWHRENHASLACLELKSTGIARHPVLTSPPRRIHFAIVALPETRANVLYQEDR